MKLASIIYLLVSIFSACWWPAAMADTVVKPTERAEAGPIQDTLNAARDHLQQAFSSYRDRDIEATRKFLLEAKALLDRSALSSASDTVKAEAKKLVAEIEAFEQKLEQGGAEEEDSIARFWHRATSFIRREAEQLLHQYVELSQNEKTFKHLLDAKMHLFIAEHDLFVSHDMRDADAQLEQVLADLALARREAIRDVIPQVEGLGDKVIELQQAMSEGSQLWLDNEVLRHLLKAQAELVEAEQTAVPNTSMRIGVIRQQIEHLRKDVETVNLRNDYDAIMEQMKQLIGRLESE